MAVNQFMNDYCSVPACSRELGLPASVIRRWVYDGEIKIILKVLIKIDFGKEKEVVSLMKRNVI